MSPLQLDPGAADQSPHRKAHHIQDLIGPKRGFNRLIKLDRQLIQRHHTQAMGQMGSEGRAAATGQGALESVEQVRCVPEAMDQHQGGGNNIKRGSR